MLGYTNDKKKTLIPELGLFIFNQNSEISFSDLYPFL